MFYSFTFATSARINNSPGHEWPPLNLICMQIKRFFRGYRFLRIIIPLNWLSFNLFYRSTTTHHRSLSLREARAMEDCQVQCISLQIIVRWHEGMMMMMARHTSSLILLMAAGSGLIQFMQEYWFCSLIRYSGQEEELCPFKDTQSRPSEKKNTLRIKPRIIIIAVFKPRRVSVGGGEQLKVWSILPAAETHPSLHINKTPMNTCNCMRWWRWKEKHEDTKSFPANCSIKVATPWQAVNNRRLLARRDILSSALFHIHTSSGKSKPCTPVCCLPFVLNEQQSVDLRWAVSVSTRLHDKNERFNGKENSVVLQFSFIISSSWTEIYFSSSWLVCWRGEWWHCEFM